MELNETAIRKIASVIFVALMGILAFWVVKPILLSVIGGLLLAYVFFPVFSRVEKTVKNRTLAALIVVFIAALLVILPIFLVAPILRTQIQHVFIFLQSLDIGAVVQKIFPASADQSFFHISENIRDATANQFASLIDGALGLIVSFIINIAVAFLVFFFALKDNHILRTFISDISPLNKSRETIVVQQFKDITNSLLFGQIIVGILQGILAGIGLFIFGVPNPLVLTGLAILFSIAPFIGPAFIWIPVTFYLFTTGNTTSAVIYLLYNLLIVSTLDNVLRAYIVSKKSKISQVIVLMGMIGGIFLFGVLGLILGPLILAYFLTFLNLHRNKNAGGHVFSE